MTIAISSDHAGFQYKQRLATLLNEAGHEVTDHGVYSDESADYPDFAAKVAKDVSEGAVERGVVVCGSGIGVSMVANRYPGVRAANCLNVEMARLARQHNDANVLALGERLLEWDDVPDIVAAFLETPTSEEERHVRRVQKIHTVTGC